MSLRDLWGPSSVAFCGVIITVIGVIVSGAAAFWASGKRADFERQLRLKSDEIAALNSKIATAVEEGNANITGGDSFCYLHVATEAGPDKSAITLLSSGKYPLYDVQVRIVDLEKWNAIANDIRLEDFMNGLASDTLLKFPSLSRNNARLLGTLQLPSNRNRYDLNVFYLARNGSWTQIIRFRRIREEWRVAWKVFREDKAILNEHHHPDFPKDLNGEIDWTDVSGTE